ncbi:hypothetical protein Tco_1287005 [Tanacetum coccineum]
MTLNEYLEYEAEKERRLRRNDIETKKYYELPPLHPCFQSAQPYTEDGLVSSNESDEVDINSMTIAKYELYIAKEDKELSFEEVFDDFFKMGAKNLRGMKQEEAEVEDCDEGNMDNIWGITVKDVERIRQLLTPTVHTLPEPDPVVQPYVPLIPFPDEVKVVREEEPDNNIDSISIHVPDVTNDVIQPLIPQTIHTTPPDKDYVALGTKPIFDELWKNSEMRS